MNDLLGNPIRVGDAVAFGRHKGTYLILGTVTTVSNYEVVCKSTLGYVERCRSGQIVRISKEELKKHIALRDKRREQRNQGKIT